MGACYSSMVSWYSWALGVNTSARGKYRYPVGGVDGEPIVEFDSLIDADPAVLELGQRVPVVTDRERAVLESGKYEEILFQQAEDGFETRQQLEEKRLQREQEAIYEAKREQARSARQAQSMEASRAAATAVAVAQATNLALRENGDMFISSAGPGTASPRSSPRVNRTQAEVSSQRATSTLDEREGDGVEPLSLNGLRNEPKLDPSHAQLNAFEQSTRKSALGNSSAAKTGHLNAVDSKPPVMTATATTVGVKKAPMISGTDPRLMRREPPSLSDNETDAPLSHADQLAQFEAAGFQAETATTEALTTMAASASKPGNEIQNTAYSVVDDDDDDDFESFLDSVQAQAMAGDSVIAAAPQEKPSAVPPSSSTPSDSAASAENERSAGAAPAEAEATPSDNEFTSFEESVQ